MVNPTDQDIITGFVLTKEINNLPLDPESPPTNCPNTNHFVDGSAHGPSNLIYQIRMCCSYFGQQSDPTRFWPLICSDYEKYKQATINDLKEKRLDLLHHIETEKSKKTKESFTSFLSIVEQLASDAHLNIQ